MGLSLKINFVVVNIVDRGIQKLHLNIRNLRSKRTHKETHKFDR
jgi:hypothetical protein